MDVGDPSNFVRILELFHHRFADLKNMLSSESISDEETRNTIKEVYTKENYLLDPHGAVAFRSLEKYLQNHPEEKGFILETAHPVKFYDVVEPIINERIQVPASVEAIMSKEKLSTIMEVGFENLKEFLLSR
jgi:threonine synthase